jgi:hypothetical protein
VKKKPDDAQASLDLTPPPAPPPPPRSSCEAALRLATENSAIFTAEFLAWLPNNCHVWRAFVDETFKVSRLGFEHYSARTIVHFLRHHSAVTEVGGPWKINDHHSPYLARLFDLSFPQHVGLWEYRETKAVKATKEPA